MEHKLALKIKDKFFYGWVIVFVSGMSLFFSAPGQTYSISTFIDYYIEDFQLSRTLISSIYSIVTIASGMLLVFIGKAVDRFGQKITLSVVTIGLAITCFYNSFVSNIAMMAVGFFFLRYFGQGGLTLIPSSLVPQWFEKKRALSISWTNLGGVLGNLSIPLINVFLITTFSWQTTWRIWSIILLIGFLPLIRMMVINKPEDIGLLPDHASTDNHDIEKALEEMERSSWSLNQAMKTRAFWITSILSMIIPMISTGLMFHFYSIMELKAISEVTAAFILGLVALPGFIMPFVTHFLMERYKARHIVSVTLLCIGIDFILLLFVSTEIAAAAFMIIYGLAINIQNVTLSVIWPNYFGRKHLGSIRGAATVFIVLGSAFGPLPFGLAFDLTGNYQVIFMIVSAIAFVGTALALSLKPPVKPKM